MIGIIRIHFIDGSKIATRGTEEEYHYIKKMLSSHNGAEIDIKKEDLKIFILAYTVKRLEFEVIK